MEEQALEGEFGMEMQCADNCPKDDLTMLDIIIMIQMAGIF